MSAPKRPVYHWVLTLQHALPYGGMGAANGSGTITPSEGQTREQLFDEIVQHVCAQTGAVRKHSSVLFFDLAPNELV